MKNIDKLFFKIYLLDFYEINKKNALEKAFSWSHLNYEFNL